MYVHTTGRIAASLAALAAAGLIDGCDAFGPADRVTVRLPEPPPHWLRAIPRLAFELEYPGPDGSLRLAGPLPWGETVTVACAKGANGAFLAWPLAGDDRRRLLRPAGGLYPSSVSAGSGGDELYLTWADGCLAVVMLRLSVAGRDPALVNAARLGGYLAVEPDPWGWDLAHIEQQLATGGFTAHDLDRLPTVDAVVQPGEGEWFLETPFGGARAAAPGGTLSLPGLTHGLHTLFGMDGRRVRIYADPRGVFTLPMTGALPAGAVAAPAPALSPRVPSAPSSRRRTRGRSRREAA
jgi:hypothetical protein